MNSCAFLNRLYAGVSNFLHNCGPLSVFKIVLLLTKAESINFADFESGWISSSVKLLNLMSNAATPTTKIRHHMIKKYIKDVCKVRKTHSAALVTKSFVFLRPVLPDLVTCHDIKIYLDSLCHFY